MTKPPPMADWKHPPPEHVGLICRSFPCICPEGQGHRHPDWIAWQAAEREHERAAEDVGP